MLFIPLLLPLLLSNPSQLTSLSPSTTVLPDTRPIVISGPSGVGKGTLYKKLLEHHPSVFRTSISHTTRAPRPGETRDVDYYYTTMEEFERMIAQGGFVEHAQFGGNRYGTSRKMIEEVGREGKIVVLDIEMEVGLRSSSCLSLASWVGHRSASRRAVSCGLARCSGRL